jgi:mannose-6-phosphate isomerase-like protein (cupin superfamily)
MSLNRRTLVKLVPAVVARFAYSTPVSKSSDKPAQAPLPSRAYPFADLAVRRNGPFVSRQVLRGETHAGFLLDLHESELGVGLMPHPPHQHVHEEVLFIREGQIDITFDGQTTRLTPGSVAYIASNVLHGWKNTGANVASYFVLALGKDDN